MKSKELLAEYVGAVLFPALPLYSVNVPEAMQSDQLFKMMNQNPHKDYCSMELAHSAGRFMESLLDIQDAGVIIKIWKVNFP